MCGCAVGASQPSLREGVKEHTLEPDSTRCKSHFEILVTLLTHLGPHCSHIYNGDIVLMQIEMTHLGSLLKILGDMSLIPKDYFRESVVGHRNL